MKYTALSIGALILIVIGAIIINSRNVTPSETSAQSDTIPNVEVQYANGETVPLVSLVDKPAMINVWASWCPFCVNELPDFNEYAQERADEFDVIIVNRGESVAKGEGFLDELGLTQSAMTIVYDPSENFYRSIGGFAMPETIFINANGEILLHKRGPISPGELRATVARLGL